MTERELNAVFFRALAPGVVVVGPHFVLLTKTGAHGGLDAPWWTRIILAVVTGCLCAFAVCDHKRRS